MYKMEPETKQGYEPDRIPPAVFAVTMTPKQEWSMQSNDSLFSIHMGDQSFSKMFKSGELSNFEYTASYVINNNDNKINSTDPGSKPVNNNNDNKINSTDPGSKPVNNNNDNKINSTDPGSKPVNMPVVETTPKIAVQDGLTNAPKQDPPQQIMYSPIKSYHSDTSNNGTASFAFPTLSEFQQEPKTPLKLKSKSALSDTSRSSRKSGRYMDDLKPKNSGGWLPCFSCFSVQK